MAEQFKLKINKTMDFLFIIDTVLKNIEVLFTSVVYKLFCKMKIYGLAQFRTVELLLESKKECFTIVC